MMRPQIKPIRLQTKRLELRTLKPTDACENWILWAKDPEVMGPLNLPARRVGLRDLANYIGSFNNHNRFLIGVFDKTKMLIGFFMVEVDQAHRLATFNVLIGEKAWWGKGVVNEARASLLDHFFRHMNVEKACGAPLARNFAAILNYKTQGWRHEGTLRGHRLSLDGSRIDQYQFGLLRSEWRETRTKGK